MGADHRTWDKFLADRLKRLDALRDLVIRHLEQAHQRQTKNYNRGPRVVQFHVGDLMWRKNHALSAGGDGFSSKSAPKFTDPYETVDILRSETYMLMVMDKRENGKVHVSQLRRFVSSRGTVPDMCDLSW